jgi:hypothetical protein
MVHRRTDGGRRQGIGEPCNKDRSNPASDNIMTGEST